MLEPRFDSRTFISFQLGLITKGSSRTEGERCRKEANKSENMLHEAAHGHSIAGSCRLIFIYTLVPRRTYALRKSDNKSAGYVRIRSSINSHKKALFQAKQAKCFFGKFCKTNAISTAFHNTRKTSLIKLICRYNFKDTSYRNAFIYRFSGNIFAKGNVTVVLRIFRELVSLLA